MAHAYVPEHVIGLITSLSTGEPFLIDDYFCCRKDDWVIFIGYPLNDRFDPAHLEKVLEKVKNRFRPGRISLIAPELPERYRSNCRESETDHYFTLDPRKVVIRSPVRRNLRKAAQHLAVESADHMGPAHQGLMAEFVQYAAPPVRVKNMLFNMPRYVGGCCESFVLNAWRTNNVLAAFYVIDYAADNFANYIIGCYSKHNYVLGASDLLLMELIKGSQKRGKRYIHLGLGVNTGIRRFKEKWGAKPSRSYNMCELFIKKPLLREAIRALMEKALPPPR